MANVAYIQRKIQLSRFSAYLDGLPSQLIYISGVLLYYYYYYYYYYCYPEDQNCRLLQNISTYMLKKEHVASWETLIINTISEILITNETSEGSSPSGT
jgi:hypothetical protein